MHEVLKKNLTLHTNQYIIILEYGMSGKYIAKEIEPLYDHIFRKYYRFVFAKAYLLLRNKQDAEDLVQAFFTDMWEKKSFMKLDETTIKGYFHIAIKNRVLNYWKKKQLDITEYQNNMDVLDDEGVFYEECLFKIEQELDKLPTQQKRAMKMVYMQEMKYEQAADGMGISINSLKSHLKLGLKKIRVKFK